MSHIHAKYLLLATCVAVALAVLCGWVFGEAMTQIAWLGTLFLNTLKMLIIPLVLTAVISAVANVGNNLGRLGGLTLGYYASTTALAVLTGLILVNIIQPGVGLNFTTPETGQNFTEKATSLSDIALSLISPNLFASAASAQMLPLIVFAILFGLALAGIGKPAKPVKDVMDGMHTAMLKIVAWVMVTAPVGIFALVAARLGSAGGGDAFWAQITSVGWYVATVIGGLSVHALVLFILMLFIAKRGMPYLIGLGRALMIAFGTASSSATLPITMECAKEQGLKPQATRFVLPLGSTVNMDGTALYEAVAVMFIAQAYGIELTFTEQTIVFLTATLAAIGAAGIPEAGLVMMVTVLAAVGLPLEGIGLLLAVDWFLDRCRTTVNVWGDAVGAAVLNRFIKER